MMNTVAELAAQFETEFARYLEEMDLLKKRVAHVRLVNIVFSKQNPFNDDEIHAYFREIFSGLCDKLTQASADADAFEVSQACEKVTSLLLASKDSKNITYWPLVACEGYALPLVSYIAPERLFNLYTDYHSANPQNRCLPNQVKIKKAMKACLKSAGLWR